MDDIKANIVKYMEETSSKKFTMPRIFGKEYNENFISNWVSFIINPTLNNIGYAPLNILVEKKFKEGGKYYPDFDNSKIREFTLNKHSRIDFLIPVINRENDKEEYYIAIENKIHSEEGIDQTHRYQQAIDLFPNNSEKNEYIYLCASGKSAKNEKFRTVTYKDFVKELEKIPLSFITDLRSAFFVQEFIIHTKEYICNVNEISQNDCKLLKATEGKMKELQQSKNQICQQAYSQCVNIRNKFFDKIYRKLCAIYDNTDYIVHKSSHSLYIQIYKKKWNKHNLHYEIIIDNHKSIPFPDCELLLMFHHEESGRNIKEFADAIGQKDFYYTNTFKNIAGYSQRLDTQNAFESPDAINRLIDEAVEKTTKIIKAYSPKANKYAASLK